MKIERTKNAGRNVLFGGLLKAYQIILPFIMRTVMIYFMGIQYLGLSSLFTSILQVLNLAELGVGSAMVYSMYKPIVDDDSKTICALMKLYKISYRIIGIIVCIMGCMLLPFIPRLVKADMPAGINIYVLYIMNLAITVLSYWLFAYKNCLLSAHQRQDVTSKITIATNTVQYVFQLIAVCVFQNYYLFVLAALFTQAATNIITAIVATRMFPSYKPDGELDKSVIKDITNRIKDLFTSKIGAVVVNSADTVVISAFLGLAALATYQNYFYILSSITGMLAVVFNSCIAGIGNSIIVESKEKNLQDLKKFTFLISWLAGFCTVCLLCLYQPFIEIWVGKELQLEFSIVICLCIYFFIYEINHLLNTYKDAGGIWHEDRFRPLITALCNLSMNLLLVNYWGLYGVVLSTVLSMLFVGMPWLLRNLFTVLFPRSQLKDYVLLLLKYACVTVLACVITYLICTAFVQPALPTFFIRLCICMVVPNVIFFIIYRNMPEFSQCAMLINRLFKGKIRWLNRYCQRIS